MTSAPGGRIAEDLQIVIEDATADDAAAIHAVRQAAFREVADFYEDPDLPPLRETLEQIREEPGSYLVLKAVVAGRIVGAVRASENEGAVHIGRLTVDPASQGKGIGTALAEAVLERFPDATRFELFTGHKSARPLAIYSRLGFRTTHEERVSDRVTLVHMELPGPAVRP